MDAAGYKDFVFDLLFLKLCSNVFDAEGSPYMQIKMTNHGIHMVTEEGT